MRTIKQIKRAKQVAQLEAADVVPQESAEWRAPFTLHPAYMWANSGTFRFLR